MDDTCSVLVVEDELAIRTLLAEALADEGFEVRAAADGRDALAVLERWRPNVILLDLNMPIIDGWALRDELRRRPRLAGIPIIALSAGRWGLDRLIGLDAVAFLPKPCDLDALIDAIRRAMSEAEAEGLEALPRLSGPAGAGDQSVIESPAPTALITDGGADG
jgi:CheY-like chemotaxis protein